MNQYAFTLIFEVKFAPEQAELQAGLMIDFIKSRLDQHGQVKEYCLESRRLTADVIYRAENPDIAEDCLVETFQQYFKGNNLIIIRINDYDND